MRELSKAQRNAIEWVANDPMGGRVIDLPPEIRQATLLSLFGKHIRGDARDLRKCWRLMLTDAGRAALQPKDS